MNKFLMSLILFFLMIGINVPKANAGLWIAIGASKEGILTGGLWKGPGIILAMGGAAFMTNSLVNSPINIVTALMGAAVLALDDDTDIQNEIKAKLMEKYTFIDSEEDLEMMATHLRVELEITKESMNNPAVDAYYIVLPGEQAAQLVSEMFLSDFEKKFLITVLADQTELKPVLKNWVN